MIKLRKVNFDKRSIRHDFSSSIRNIIYYLEEYEIAYKTANALLPKRVSTEGSLGVLLLEVLIRIKGFANYGHW
jgi:hypothetical protein